LKQEASTDKTNTPAQVAVPLSAAEMPPDPNFHMFFVDYSGVFDSHGAARPARAS
jgi:hypothetical protein